MNNSIARTKVTKSINECEIHQRRIEHALGKMKKFMPLTEKNYEILNDDQIEALDQFLFRFSKLQDTISQRLFSGVLELLQEPVKEMSFLDRLNRLEQLSILTSKDQWLTLRNLRNSLAHEYEDDTKGMYQAINQIYKSYQVLSNIFLKIKDYISNNLN